MQRGDIELLEDVVVPLQGVDVEEHGTRGVGVVGHVDLAARQLPDEPRLDRAEQQLAALCALTGAGDIFEQPVDLCAGEVGVDDEAGLGAEGIGQALGLERVAVFARPAALPDDGVVDGLTGDLIPDDRGLALVGDADGGDIGGSCADLLHGLDSYAKLRGPDLICVVLDPAGFRKVLGNSRCETLHISPLSLKRMQRLEVVPASRAMMYFAMNTSSLSFLKIFMITPWWYLQKIV